MSGEIHGLLVILPKPPRDNVGFEVDGAFMVMPEEMGMAHIQTGITSVRTDQCMIEPRQLQCRVVSCRDVDAGVISALGNLDSCVVVGSRKKGLNDTMSYWSH